ncbi:hypothetical protein C4580_05485 [Candidatus Woesearchaeota archaeon]|nr:MAG: hypothetical protein C4580_05485 [Candidatus Woesearchaeota archaeon]
MKPEIDYFKTVGQKLATTTPRRDGDKTFFAQLLLLRHIPSEGISFEHLCDRINEDFQALREEPIGFDWGYWSGSTVLGACEFLEQCDMLYATYEDPSGSIHPTMKTYRPTERTQEFMNAIKQSLDRKISD